MMHKHIRYSPLSVPMCGEDFPEQERNPTGRPPVRDRKGIREAGVSSLAEQVFSYGGGQVFSEKCL
jgi:hypothetical protein